MRSEPAWARRKRLDREAKDEARFQRDVVGPQTETVVTEDFAPRADPGCAWCRMWAGSYVRRDGVLVCVECAERGHAPKGDWE